MYSIIANQFQKAVKEKKFESCFWLSYSYIINVTLLFYGLKKKRD